MDGRVIDRFYDIWACANDRDQVRLRPEPATSNRAFDTADLNIAIGMEAAADMIRKSESYEPIVRADSPPLHRAELA